MSSTMSHLIVRLARFHEVPFLGPWTMFFGVVALLFPALSLLIPTEPTIDSGMFPPIPMCDRDTSGTKDARSYLDRQGFCLTP